MSFTIKCNKCGKEQEFENLDKQYKDNISIVPYIRGTYTGTTVDSIDIDCENPECNNTIEIEC